ncbi:Protein of unknown function [Pyronema omphalodes CBS 100304]|uniref:Uncharacterized protein n=1 Tax=Pyronema omphalodes (strain CBS 100304) TaxID=1076935 RepID=U4L182_PYROM|nr:Protein of unknown function [Pyronema omphalodes CBS 100304]
MRDGLQDVYFFSCRRKFFCRAVGARWINSICMYMVSCDSETSTGLITAELQSFDPLTLDTPNSGAEMKQLRP